jgi:putative membrane protein
MWAMVIFIAPSFTSNLLLYFTFMKEDPLFYLRRCLAFSLFTMATWVVIFLISSVLAIFLPAFVFPDFAVVVGLFAVLPLRALAVFSMSSTSFVKRTIFTLMEPSLTALAVSAVFGISPGRIVMGMVTASLVGLTFAFALVSVVELYGRREIGFSPIRMFRAFLTDWLEGKNRDLESYLNELGVETEIDLAAFVFRPKGKSDIKGVVLVSNFHPGPFLNIGSSALPFLFQSVIRRRFNAVAMVPHGVSGHELNLVSQDQNARIIQWVLAKLETVRYLEKATPVIRAKNDFATATSQVFDGCALVTMTTAPYDMEDVPSEVKNRLSGLTHGRFRHLALIDAHNCLTGPATMTSRKIGALEDAALSALQISSEHSSSKFSVGVSRRVPAGFTLKDGLGPGGISVLGIEADEQRFAYVNIDGNNMIRGLREKILESAKGVGFDDGEATTTDTHMVNGVVSARLGYHPVGEVGPTESLLGEVADACREAMVNLEPCEVGVFSGQMPVTTLGSKSLRRVMHLVYRISELTAITLFPMVPIIAALSLVFLV